MAHTEGEWEIVRSNGGRHVGIKAGHASICKVSAGLHQEDNARLMGAAPKLMEALEVLQDNFCDRWCKDLDSGDHFEECQNATAAIRAAKEAS